VIWIKGTNVVSWIRNFHFKRTRKLNLPSEGCRKNTSSNHLNIWEKVWPGGEGKSRKKLIEWKCGERWWWKTCSHTKFRRTFRVKYSEKWVDDVVFSERKLRAFVSTWPRQREDFLNSSRIEKQKGKAPSGFEGWNDFFFRKNLFAIAILQNSPPSHSKATAC
jgi:hypothetical protein